MGVSLGRHDIGNALATEITTLCYNNYSVLWRSYAEVASPANYPSVSFVSFLWLCYLPNSVAANGNCNAVMLGVNVAPIV